MPTIIIDSLPQSAEKYYDDWTIVVVDILRFTTTATTVMAVGHKVYPASTTEDAFTLAERFANPLLAGELGGNVPYGFHVTNSPVQLLALSRIPCGTRPVILVSSSGAQLLTNAKYLINTGQIHDLEFVIHYQNDLDTVPMLADDGSLVDVGESLENS